MIDKFGLKGKYHIKSSNGYEIEFDNLIVNGGLSNLAALLAGTGDTIGYLALGTGKATPANTDTALGKETFRTAVTGVSASGASCSSVFTVLAAEAVGAITEIGIFAGGTSTANSGTLISRALWSYTKTADEELYITRTDTIGRA